MVCFGFRSFCFCLFVRLLLCFRWCLELLVAWDLPVRFHHSIVLDIQLVYLQNPHKYAQTQTHLSALTHAHPPPPLNPPNTPRCFHTHPLSFLFRRLYVLGCHPSTIPLTNSLSEGSPLATQLPSVDKFLHVKWISSLFSSLLLPTSSLPDKHDDRICTEAAGDFLKACTLSCCRTGPQPFDWYTFTVVEKLCGLKIKVVWRGVVLFLSLCFCFVSFAFVIVYFLRSFVFVVFLSRKFLYFHLGEPRRVCRTRFIFRAVNSSSVNACLGTLWGEFYLR